MLFAPSDCEPPRNVANGSAEPAAFSSAMTASRPPLMMASDASALTGKSADDVPPANQALPAGSSTMPPTESFALPPMSVEYTSADPVGLNLVTKPSPLLASGVVSNAPGVVGKFGEEVPPATDALPAPSTATSAPLSESCPPRYVE